MNYKLFLSQDLERIRKVEDPKEEEVEEICYQASENIKRGGRNHAISNKKSGRISLPPRLFVTKSKLIAIVF